MRNFTICRTLCLCLVSLALSTPATAMGYDVRYQDSVVYPDLGTLRTTLWGGGLSPSVHAFDVPLPFSFVYDGQVQTTLHISRYGFVSFEPAITQPWVNQSLPSTASPNNGLIAPWWDDLQYTSFSGSPCEIAYEQTTSAFGTQTFTVEWKNVTRTGDTEADRSNRTFQVQLHYPSMEIVFFYGDQDTRGFALAGSASVGLESRDGMTAVTPVLGSPGLVYGQTIREGMALTFVPAAVPGHTLELDRSTYAPLTSRLVIWDGSMGDSLDEEFTVSLTGWTFPYDSVNHSTLQITTEGMIFFGGTAGDIGLNQALPDPAAPNAVIAPLWDDLAVRDFGVTDEISIASSGTSPNHRLVVQWSSVSRESDTRFDYHHLDFQAHLFESGRIEFHYGLTTRIGAPPALLSSTIGLENGAGTRATLPVQMSSVMGLPAMPNAGTILAFEPAPLVCGDCNDDGVVAITDALVAAQDAAGLVTLTGALMASCNVQGTLGSSTTPGAVIDVLDALEIARFTAGLSSSLSCAP